MNTQQKDIEDLDRIELIEIEGGDATPGMAVLWIIGAAAVIGGVIRFSVD